MQPKRSIIRAVVMTCLNHVFVIVSLKKIYFDVNVGPPEKGG